MTTDMKSEAYRMVAVMTCGDRKQELGVVAHAHDPSTLETEACTMTDCVLDFFILWMLASDMGYMHL